MAAIPSHTIVKFYSHRMRVGREGDGEEGRCNSPFHRSSVRLFCVWGWDWGGDRRVYSVQQLTPEVEFESVRNTRTFRAFTVAQSLFFLLSLHIQYILAHLSIPHHSGSTMVIPKHLCPQSVCPAPPPPLHTLRWSSAIESTPQPQVRWTASSP